MSIADKLQEAIAEARPTLVEFYADWCPHCQRMMPVVAELKKQKGGVANIIQIEGDQNHDLMEKYHIHSYPTWIIFKDGQECWRDGGEKPLSELNDMIDRFV